MNNAFGATFAIQAGDRVGAAEVIVAAAPDEVLAASGALELSDDVAAKKSSATGDGDAFVRANSLISGVFSF